MSAATYDPKHKKHSPHRSVVKLVTVIFCCLGVIVALRIQKGLVNKKQGETTSQDVIATITEEQIENVHVDRLAETSNTETGFSIATPREDTPVPPPEATAPAAGISTTSNPNLPFSKERPLIVLSLPHNADLAVSRYLKCGGVVPTEHGKFWSTLSGKMPLGRCMLNNLLNNATSITQACGNFAVFLELQFVEPPQSKGPSKHASRCFDPVLFPDALNQLYKAVPNAIILTVQQNRQAWYSHLPKDRKAHWKKWCNPTHQNLFPFSTSSTTKFAQFYKEYHERLSTFIEQHEGWEHVNINLEADIETTGTKLEERLNIPAKCWAESIQAPLEAGEDTNTEGKMRPNTIHYPILSVSLPKSGIATAHEYFKCGLGGPNTAFQWTTPSSSTEEHPAQNIPIGKCIEENHRKNDNDNILKGCGNARVWSDIGYLRDKTGTCFYPTMQPGQSVLEKFAHFYPRGTIVQIIRPAQDWYHSAHTHNNLPKRWTHLEHCSGFPPPQANPEQWYQFYEEHTQSIRDFAAKHTNLTYLEIPLSTAGGQMMNDIFQFPEHCWPDILDDAP